MKAYQNLTQLSIPKSVKVHSTLAQVIVSSKEHTRDYALWAVLRSFDSSGDFDKQSVISFAMSQTGKAQSTIYTWIKSGEEVFWNTSNGRLWLIGKKKVFDYFLGEGVKPGKVVFVPSELILTSKLHVVRSNLSATWITKDSGKIISRVGRKNILQVGIPERTQQTYDETANVKVKSIIVGNSNEKKQLSNWYGMPASFTTLNTDKALKTKFYEYRPTDFNMVENIKIDNDFGSFNRVEKHVMGNDTQDKIDSDRIYFSDVNMANEIAEYRKENQISTPVYIIHNKNTGKGIIISTWLH